MSLFQVDIRYVYTDPQGNEHSYTSSFYRDELPTLGKIFDRRGATYIPEDLRTLYEVKIVEQKGLRHYAVEVRSIPCADCVRGHKFTETHRGSIPGKRMK